MTRSGKNLEKNEAVGAAKWQIKLEQSGKGFINEVETAE